MNSLWGDEFDLPNEQETAKEVNKKLAGKTSDQLIKSKSTPIKAKVDLVTTEVYRILGHYKDIITTIKSRQELHDYITKAIENDIVAIDTETNNSLDPITCKLMGLCLYTPDLKAAYVPINHVDIDTNKRLEWQVTEKDVYDELTRIYNIKVLVHNGQFDYQVLKCTCDVELPIYWDTLGAAHMINENEKAGLKWQYINKVDNTQEEYEIEKLFSGLSYAIFDPDVFAYYSAVDPYMTYELYKWQVEKFKDSDLQGNYKLFKDIEVPLESILARMTLRGVALDDIYSNRLKEKYTKLQDDAVGRINTEYAKYKDIVDDWRLTPEANKKTVTLYGNEGKSKNQQLTEPANLMSNLQLAIVLYDVLKLPQVSKKKKDCVDDDALTKLSKARPDLKLCELILEKRSLDKLMSTYIEAIPNVANKKDKRVHPSFNNYGTVTGRLSSKDPNFQNLPSHNNEIRTMVCATKGGEQEVEFTDYIELEPYDELKLYPNNWTKVKDVKGNEMIMVGDKVCFIDKTEYIPIHVKYRLYISKKEESIRNIIIRKAQKVLVGSDYSQLEVKTMVHTCNDANAIQAYKDGRDMYSYIASMSTGKPYEECLEFYPEGYVLHTPNGDHVCKAHEITNVDGKKQRSQYKSILLGVQYGRGTASIMEQLNEQADDPSQKKTKEEVQQLVDNLFAAFPSMHKWMTDAQKQVKEKGYVFSAIGRRRYLPDALLPKYEITLANPPFNPFLNCEQVTENPLITKYRALLNNAKWHSDVEKIQADAKLEGVVIKSNDGFIAQAERQAINSPCQSLGADIVKQLMIVVDNDKELKDLGFTLLLQIHDEIMGECPIETKDQVIDRINYLMSKVPDDMGMRVPFTTDAYYVSNWYIDEIENGLLKSFTKLTQDKGMSKEDAVEEIYSKHTELTKGAIRDFLINGNPLVTA